VVAREDEGRAAPLPGQLEPGVARDAGSGLARVGPERAPAFLVPQPIRLGARAHPGCHLRARRMDAVVEMRDGQLLPMRFPGPMKQVEQRDRVGTAGHRHKGTARRECQHMELIAEGVEQGHRA